MRTRVKICGITRIEDGAAAARHGADAVGFNFYPPSSRAVTPARAAQLAGALPPFVSVVALFVNPREDEVREVLDSLRVDAIQFHGDEPAGDCERFGVPYIKAVRVRGPADIEQAAVAHPNAGALLLDAHREGLWGGTGTTFDWSHAPRELGRPLMLAGGLDAGNVAEAVARVRPFAVDVSGGVESAPGCKDEGRIESFINEVNRVGAS